MKTFILTIGMGIALASLADAQAVRLDSQSTNPRLNNRLNQERLTAAETKVETGKINQRQNTAKQKSTTSRTAKSNQSAIRREEFDRKKKKRIIIDRDF